MLAQTVGVQVVVIPESDGAGRVRFVESGRDERVADLARLIAEVEAAEAPRWVLPAADALPILKERCKSTLL